MTTPATLANLLAQMYQDKEVLSGWDAVLNLLESALNSFFQQQWAARTGGAGQMTVAAVWCGPAAPIGGSYVTTVTDMSIEFGAPLFQFANGQNQVTVTQAILGGTLRTGTMVVPSTFVPSDCDCKPNDPRVQWTAPQTINLAARPALQGKVALEAVQGLVNATSHSLVLDFAKGAFTLNQLTVTGVSVQAIVNQIVDWFATNGVTYVLASLNFQDLASLPALTPTSFQFRVLTTGAGNTVVQILITTNGSQPAGVPIVDEPVPTADNLTCSLMVNSRILYNDILVNGFNQGGASYKLVAAPPGTADGPWYAVISPEMDFSGSFSFGSCCDRETVTYNIYLGGNYSGSPTSGFTLSQHQTTGGNVNVDITVSAQYPVSLSGTGHSQQFVIVPGTPTVTVTGSAEGEIESTLNSILTGDLRASMAGVSFTPISAFALQNLLFPDNLINMSQAQVPGDLLIVGTFEAT